MGLTARVDVVALALMKNKFLVSSIIIGATGAVLIGAGCVPTVTGRSTMGVPVIRQLADEGMTMVIVSHEMMFAREVADRIIFMDEGLVVEEGSPQAMFTSPRTERLRTYLRRFAYNEAVVMAAVQT